MSIKDLDDELRAKSNRMVTTLVLRMVELAKNGSHAASASRLKYLCLDVMEAAAMVAQRASCSEEQWLSLCGEAWKCASETRPS